MSNVIDFKAREQTFGEASLRANLEALKSRKREIALAVLVPRLRELQAQAQAYADQSGRPFEMSTRGGMQVMFDHNGSGTYFGVRIGPELFMSGYFTPKGAGQYCSGTVDIMSWKRRSTWEHRLFETQKASPAVA